MQANHRYTVQMAPPQPTLLVISDDPSWRSAVQQMLQGQGFGVLCARHAGHALVACMRHDGPVHLVIADGTRYPGDIAPLTRQHPGLRGIVLNHCPASRAELLSTVQFALSQAREA